MVWFVVLVNSFDYRFLYLVCSRLSASPGESSRDQQNQHGHKGKIVD
jgi:hypothetical protein